MTCGPSSAAPIAAIARTDQLPAVSVKDFGATGDGVTDDRAAVQAAIDSLTNGGTVFFPPGTYLMDSSVQAKAGDRFNLVTSHDRLTFEPAPGAPGGSVKLIQGPHGWGTAAHRTFGPLAVFNSECFMASPIGQNGYQNVQQNGGYYTLKAPVLAESRAVAFAKPAEAGRFAAGDWIAVSETTDQQIEPLEINQVESVNAATGEVVLRWPQIQTYPTGFAAKVTHMVRSHIALRGLTLQGVSPCFLNDLYDLEITDCKLLCDVSYADPAKGSYMFANGVRQMLFKNNLIADFPAGSVANVDGVELPQNNSIEVTIEHNTFLASAGGGEYCARWVLRNNSFQIFPAPAGTRHGVCVQGYDMLFEGNTLTSTAGLDYLYTDYSTAPNPYRWLFGAQSIRGNRFLSAAGKHVVRLYTPDTEFTGNEIRGGPEQHALFVDISGRPHKNLTSLEVQATNVITNNTFHGSVTSAFGCVLLSGFRLDGLVFHNNTLVSQDHSVYGVWVQSDSNDETHRAPALEGNQVEGFKTPVFYAPNRRSKEPKPARP